MLSPLSRSHAGVQARSTAQMDADLLSILKPGSPDLDGGEPELHHGTADTRYRDAVVFGTPKSPGRYSGGRKAEEPREPPWITIARKRQHQHNSQRAKSGSIQHLKTTTQADNGAHPAVSMPLATPPAAVSNAPTSWPPILPITDADITSPITATSEGSAAAHPLTTQTIVPHVWPPLIPNTTKAHGKPAEEHNYQDVTIKNEDAAISIAPVAPIASIWMEIPPATLKAHGESERRTGHAKESGHQRATTNTIARPKPLTSTPLWADVPAKSQPSTITNKGAAERYVEHILSSLDKSHLYNANYSSSGSQSSASSPFSSPMSSFSVSTSSSGSILVPPITPNPYDGCANRRLFERFVFEGTTYVHSARYPLTAQVQALSYFISGRAYDFFQREVSRACASWSLPDFFAELYNYCFPAEFRGEQLQIARRVLQGNVSVATYARGLEALYTLSGPGPGRGKGLRARVRKLWSGLRPELQDALWRERFDPDTATWEEVVAHAGAAERAERRPGAGAWDRSALEYRPRPRSARSDETEFDEDDTQIAFSPFGSDDDMDRRLGYGRKRKEYGPSRLTSHPDHSRQWDVTHSRSRKAPDSRGPDLQNSSRCFYCAKFGHASRHCPRRREAAELQ